MRSMPTLVLASLILGSCARNEQTASDDPYEPPPSVGTYPATAATIAQWIQARDTTSIRQHGWAIWQSITTPSAADPKIPIWETWYSGHEIFDPPDSVVSSKAKPTKIVRHPVRRVLQAPRQFGHTRVRGAGGIPIDGAERVFGFNKYTQSTANFIYMNRLWDYQILKDTNEAFNRLSTPIAQREVLVSADSVDPQSFVLKSVFQFIDGQRPSCIPYWGGKGVNNTSDTLNPIANTWKQFVLVDPTNQLAAGTRASGRYRGCPGIGPWLVVPLDKFYWVRITPEEAAAFSEFAATSGDDIGAGNDTARDSICEMVIPDNIALLTAMHVTGKEAVNWTWQTFWWSPTPNDSLGWDRPSSIGAPWNNYQMNVAYYMSWPNAPGGVGQVSYNPYLETSLCANAPVCKGSSWYGPQTNCMSCHRNATWKDLPPPNYITGLPYVPATYVDKGGSQFAGYTKVDFLWSVAIRTRNIPGSSPPPPGRTCPGPAR
jgi:hypothetical protein